MTNLPRIIPVIDLREGCAVWGIGGDRSHYVPLQSQLHPNASNPRNLACSIRDRLGLTEVYVADLDAIDAINSPNTDLYQDLASLGLKLWVDAGIRTEKDMQKTIFGKAVWRVILGLETLSGPGELRSIVAYAGPDRLAFSLDMREGRPIVSTFDLWGTEDPARLAGIALETGITRLLVLDVARIGTGRGAGTLCLLNRLRKLHPSIELIAGGGVAGPRDLVTLGMAGISAVLVGSALHDGRLNPKKT